MIASIRRLLFGATWNKNSDFEAHWEGRTAEMSRLIPEGSSVIEFGASRSLLRKYLAPDTEYFPTDITQSTGCAFIDLNYVTIERQPERTFDVAFLAGVLEYVKDVPHVAEYLFGIARTVIVSYVVTEFVPSQFRRKTHGWVNHFSDYTFVRAFHKAGWVNTYSEVYGQQRIYKFERRYAKDWAVADDYHKPEDFIAELREVATSNLPDAEKLDLLVRKLDVLDENGDPVEEPLPPLSYLDAQQVRGYRSLGNHGEQSKP